MDERIDILLARYFSGEASTDELTQLDVWLTESKDHEDYFEQMTNLYRKMSLAPAMTLPDTEKALASYKEYIGQSSQTFKKRNTGKRFFGYAIAAVVALLIGVFVFININDNSQSIMYVKAENGDTLYQVSPYCEVALMQGSHIEYHKKNIDSIKLFGKATFTINSAEGKTIIVQAGETFIKDIGTSFTVIAYNPKEEVTVEVIQGEVLFYSRNIQGINLKENEVGHFNSKQKHFSQTEKKVATNIEEDEKDEKDEELLLLSTKEKSKEKKEEPKQRAKKEKDKPSFENLEFSATSLDKVVDVLKDKFHVDIVFEDKSMCSMQINASFNNEQSIDEILSIIAETLSIQISKYGTVYIISPQ